MEMNEQQRRDFLASLGLMLERLNGGLGQILADGGQVGSMICVGGGNKASGRRWAVLLATNDAADALVEFSDQQTRGRTDAARKAGIPVTTMDTFTIDDGESPLPPRG